MLEGFRVPPIGRLVVGRAVDVVEDRTGQPLLRKAAKVVEIDAVFEAHGAILDKGSGGAGGRRPADLVGAFS
jgi:hypothetical protein